MTTKKYYKPIDKRGTCKHVTGSGECGHRLVSKDCRKCQYAIRVCDAQKKSETYVICENEI